MLAIMLKYMKMKQQSLSWRKQEGIDHSELWEGRSRGGTIGKTQQMGILKVLNGHTSSVKITQ